MLELLEDISAKVKSKKKSKKYVNEVLKDYWICLVSRQVSLLTRREVLSGRGKFGISGDGKEVPQVAMARAFKKGDFRSGYYRDQTFMFALGLCTIQEFFAQLYADPDRDPFSGGRQMNSHFSTPFIDENGEGLALVDRYNISSDISCTAGQMARATGLAMASKKYRDIKHLSKASAMSKNGNEVTFCTIGDSSTSEGVFWETVNAAGVHQIPMAISVWDDGYGISVPVEYQTTKGNISEILKGFVPDNSNGMDIYTAKGWDYVTLCEMYERGIEKIRETHVPALFHVKELTQPQGHSTSGSHERYKSEERLNWEKEHDCNVKMREWILDSKIVDDKILKEMEDQAKSYVREEKNMAWKNYQSLIMSETAKLVAILDDIKVEGSEKAVGEAKSELAEMFNPDLCDPLAVGRRMNLELRLEHNVEFPELNQWIARLENKGNADYITHLYSSSKKAAIKIEPIAPIYTENSQSLNGYEVLNTYFKSAFARYPNLLAFGEDVGFIGDVNQGLAGLQKIYGEERIFDTGIRESTIIGQAIGLSMRGFKPLAEIQYLDYLIYGLQTMSDDMATLRFRTKNLQQAPAIIRTRGHRLEGIWHSGSPMGMLLNSLRGIYILTPRNMVQACGFYNTMLKSDDPALLIECLNGYRLKEDVPDNLDDFSLPLGVPEILIPGEDVTLVTYGSCVRIAEKACIFLESKAISVELIDVQSLIPFDLEHKILASIKKTSKVLFLDEDVPGGASAYMMQKVIEEQGGYQYLDGKPRTLTAKDNRSPYGSTGDYFVKPNVEDVIEEVLDLLQE